MVVLAAAVVTKAGKGEEGAPVAVAAMGRLCARRQAGERPPAASPTHDRIADCPASRGWERVAQRALQWVPLPLPLLIPRSLSPTGLPNGGVAFSSMRGAVGRLPPPRCLLPVLLPPLSLLLALLRLGLPHHSWRSPPLGPLLQPWCPANLWT